MNSLGDWKSRSKSTGGHIWGKLGSRRRSSAAIREASRGGFSGEWDWKMRFFSLIVLPKNGAVSIISL